MQSLDEAINYYDAGEYDKAFPLFMRAAEAGNAVAQNYIGCCYNCGKGVERDYAQAVYWFTLSAEQGNCFAQFNLGNNYYFGRGTARDFAKAVYWFRQSAEQGDALAQQSLACCYDCGEGVEQDYTQAFYWFKKSAEQGCAEAQRDVGLCYIKGQGVQKDHVEAVKWFEKADSQGNISAKHALAVCYLYGRGVVCDKDKAISMLGYCAERAVSLSMYVLGDCYAKGMGVNEDRVIALRWYKLAYLFADPQYIAVLGGNKVQFDFDPKARSQIQKHIDRLLDSGSVTKEQLDSPLDGEPCYSIAKQYAEPLIKYQIALAFSGAGRYVKLPTDLQKAYELFLSAAETYPPAQTQVGACYYLGRGCPLDYDEAFRWFTRAYKNGDFNALGYLEECYEHGHGTPQDLQKAADLLIELDKAEDSNGGYQTRLMKLYAGGQITIPEELAKEYKQRFESLIAEAEAGSCVRQFELARHYETGDWGVLDYELALKWYTAGARQGDHMCKHYIPGVKQAIKDQKRESKRAKKK